MERDNERLSDGLCRGGWVSSSALADQECLWSNILVHLPATIDPLEIHRSYVTQCDIHVFGDRVRDSGAA